MQAVINFIEANWEAFKRECAENGTDPDETLKDLKQALKRHLGRGFFKLT